MELNPEIRAYYEKAPEAERLSTGCFQLEFERTKELLLEGLPKPPATILDAGGGRGSTRFGWPDLAMTSNLSIRSRGM